MRALLTAGSAAAGVLLLGGCAAGLPPSAAFACCPSTASACCCWGAFGAFCNCGGTGSAKDGVEGGPFPKPFPPACCGGRFCCFCRAAATATELRRRRHPCSTCKSWRWQGGDQSSGEYQTFTWPRGVPHLEGRRPPRAGVLQNSGQHWRLLLSQSLVKGSGVCGAIASGATGMISHSG